MRRRCVSSRAIPPSREGEVRSRQYPFASARRRGAATLLEGRLDPGKREAGKVPLCHRLTGIAGHDLDGRYPSLAEPDDLGREGANPRAEVKQTDVRRLWFEAFQAAATRA